MRIVVASCWNYRDAWKPFFALLDKFWPNHPETHLLSGFPTGDYGIEAKYQCRLWVVPSDYDWCRTLRSFVSWVDLKNEPLLVFQEDFFLSAPVNVAKIQRAAEELEKIDAGCVRLYPCPGAESEYGDPEFGEIYRGTPYRISCQAALWRPVYLGRIAEVGGEAMHFELNGSRLSDSLPEPVLGWKRAVTPWPMEYLCSAISRGKWNPDAKKLCDQYGIENDWSMRPFAA